MNVAVLGASANPERYANKAMKKLLEAGHNVFLVNPRGGEIDGLKVYNTLAEVPEHCDTVTVYVGPQHIMPVIPQIIAARPNRVIANPGAESMFLKAAVQAARIVYQEACTLVLLSTGQF